jgi:apolipoprotein N-acyltransferase
LRAVQILGSLARSRYVLAILAGLLLAAAFPNFNVAGLAWIAPGLILACALGKEGGEAFRIGYVAGLAHYLASLYWLLLIPYRWHGVPLGPAAGWLALGMFLALFPATWVWLLSSARTKRLSTDPPPAPANLIDSHLGASWGSRAIRALAGAALWVALEMLLARIFTGFPWNQLGASQHRLVPLLQIADVTGIYGVAFLAVWFSLSLLSAALILIRRPASKSAWLGEILMPTLVVALVFNMGLRQLKQATPPERVLKITLVQPSIPQTVIWDPNGADLRFREVLQLSEQALSNRTDLLVWPESAVPKLLRYDKATYEAIIDLAKRHHVWMIVGADDAEPKRKPDGNKDEADFFNSSFLISPEGRLVDRYKKRSLVIFGEYIPLVRWLPFVKWFTPIQSGFTAGEASGQFKLGDLDLTASILICFEDIFPHVTRSSVEARTDFLVNITNDGWFGTGAAQWQHAMSALLRTVENRRPLIRCTNNGITCWIDSYGRVQQVFQDPAGTAYGKGFMNFELPLPARHQPLTFYTLHGDVFGWICSAVGFLLLVPRLIGVWRRWFPGPEPVEKL